MNRFILTLLSVVFINSIYADTPLTYTDFYKAYTDISYVQKAQESKGKLSNEIVVYLGDDANPLDVKLAIINAVGWEHKGLSNSKSFLDYVIKKNGYKINAGTKFLDFKSQATPEELICYAYLRAMDNYFDVAYANEIAELALKKSPNSYAINMIARLIKAQGLNLLNEDCYAFQQFNILKTNTQLIMDMRKEAEKYIFEYIDSLGVNCK